MTDIGILTDWQVMEWLEQADEGVSLVHLVRLMESREAWVCDDPRFLAGAADLAARFQTGPPLPDDIDLLHRLLLVLAYLHTAAGLRLAALTGERNAGALVDLCVSPEFAPSAEIRAGAEVVLERLLILARHECLHRVFGRETQARVLRTLNAMEIRF